MTNRVLTVHPSYAKLDFLKIFIRHLTRRYEDGVIHSRLHTSDESHERCLMRLRSAPDSFLIMLCHGTPGNIRGCDRSVYGSHGYHWGTFISPSKNVDIFDTKRVLCIACDSKTLGNVAVKAGAKVFIGFDAIRFFWPKEKNQDAPLTGVSRRADAICRYEFRMAIEESVIAAIDNRYTFNQMSLHLRYSLQKRANKKLLVKSRKTRKINLEIAKSLMNIRNGITLFGDGNVKVFDDV